MKAAKQRERTKRRHPGGPEPRVVAIEYQPAPDAEARLRRIAAILLEHAKADPPPETVSFARGPPCGRSDREAPRAHGEDLPAPGGGAQRRRLRRAHRRRVGSRRHGRAQCAAMVAALNTIRGARAATGRGPEDALEPDAGSILVREQLREFDKVCEVNRQASLSGSLSDLAFVVGEAALKMRTPERSDPSRRPSLLPPVDGAILRLWY